MAMDGQKCGRMDRMDCQTDGRTDDAKIISPDFAGSGCNKEAGWRLKIF